MKKEKTLFQKVSEAKQVIRKSFKGIPRVGIILGTGLGDIRRRMDVTREIPYEKIPYFPKTTAVSHKGQLIFGKFEGVPVVVMEGRFHAYEGYSMEEVTFPVRVMKSLGINTLVISNASGGLNPLYKKGDIVAVSDHINFMGANPLVGPNEDKLGIRFPDMIEPYSGRLLKVAETVALKAGIPLKQGIYIGVLGPCLETRAEYRMMRAWGADLVGMSTVPEVIVAVHAGLEVLALSVVTDMCLPDNLKPASVEEIIAVAGKTGPRLADLIGQVLRKIPAQNSSK